MLGIYLLAFMVDVKNQTDNLAESGKLGAGEGGSDSKRILSDPSLVEANTGPFFIG